MEILSNRIGRNKKLDASNVVSLSTVRPFVTTDRLELLDFSDVTLTNRQNSTSTTNELPISSTTESLAATTTTLPILEPSKTKTNLSPDVKKTPASDLISDNSLTSNAEPFYESDADIMSSTTTLAPMTTTDPEDNNELALEINGGLSSMSTVFPYLGESQENEEATGNQLNSLSRLEDRSEVSRTTQAPEPATTVFGLEAQSTGNFFRGQSVTLSTLLTPPSQKPPTTEILPPRFTTEESSEQLYGAHSQSFVTGKQNSFSDDDKSQRRGKLVEPTTVSYEFINRRTTEAPQREPVNTTTTPGSPRGHYITKSIPSALLTTTTESPISTTPESAATVTYPDSGKISPNPWSSLAYTVFLDPLTINDGLMDSKENTETTASIPLRTTIPYEPTTESSSTRFGLRASFRDGSTTDRDVDIVTTTETMQRRANEMFGGLNDTSVAHLMNVMKKAESNQKVRRLILLLIQTCDDDYDKTVEESRKALLDALIGMDNNDIDETKVQIINGRNGRKIDLGNVRNAVEAQQQLTSTTQDIPITTYRGSQRNPVVPSVETRLSTPFLDPSPSSTTTTTTTTTTEATSTYAPTSTAIPTTYFAGTSTTQSPKTAKPKGSRKRPVSRDNDEYLSEETLSTFAEFGKRTTPLGTVTTTYYPPTYTTEELPEAQPTTFFPVFSRTRQRLQDTTTFEPIVIIDTTIPPTTTTPPPPPPTTTTTTTTTTTSTTTTPRPTTTTTTTTPVPPPPTTRATRGPRRKTTTVPITTTAAPPPPSRGRISKSVESYLGDGSAPTAHSDDRALDLLKSLYSLAAKWGRR